MPATHISATPQLTAARLLVTPVDIVVTTARKSFAENPPVRATSSSLVLLKGHAAFPQLLVDPRSQGHRRNSFKRSFGMFRAQVGQCGRVRS
jgi:hypothetical protein